MNREKVGLTLGKDRRGDRSIKSRDQIVSRYCNRFLSPYHRLQPSSMRVGLSLISILSAFFSSFFERPIPSGIFAWYE